MDSRPIGIFDSGLGGLTAVRQFELLAPNEDLIFFGDTARVPYGTRTPQTITEYALEDISFLLAHGVKAVVAACGTVSSTLSPEYSSKIPVPFVDTIKPTASAAANATKNGVIGILGTPATIRSDSFARALRDINANFTLLSQPCAMFVPLVENGYFSRECEATRLFAREYLAPLKAAHADTIILGCTHYPLIRDIIADEAGENVTLIDSGYETARYTVSLLEALGLTNDSGGAERFYTSDGGDAFSSLSEILLGHPHTNGVEKASLDDYPLNECFRQTR